MKLRFTCGVARLVYIDETGSVGRAAKGQPSLILVGVIVNEDKVQPLSSALVQVAMDHLGWRPAEFELHGYEIWSGRGYWNRKSPAERMAAYEQAISVLSDLEIEVAFSSIHKQRLHDRYAGGADRNAYLLALQFLLEKVDSYSSHLKIVIADEAKEHQFRAIKMVADMQAWGGGEVPGHPLQTVIDSMHFVASHSSPGVQLADLVAFILQRKGSGRDTHPEAVAGLDRLFSAVMDHARTWREEWPRA